MALLARRVAGSRRRMLADINVVPYIDVMLVLVVILMVSAPFVNPSLVNLPSVGSVSPYVGLFGTVWGIMHAFTGLSSLEQATLASVAPGIAEALIATAIGLFAAIPAVVAYNRFAHDIDRLATRFETFIEEFSNILQRQR